MKKKKKNEINQCDTNFALPVLLDRNREKERE